MNRLSLVVMVACAIGSGACPTSAQDAAVGAAAPFDLSPGATAARHELAEEPPPSGPVRPEDEADSSEKIPGLVRASHASLIDKGSVLVEEVAWRVMQPWRQARHADRVRYWFIGQTFDAEILDDGSVRFRPKQGLTISTATISEATPGSKQSSEGALPGGRGADDRRDIGSPTGVGVGIGIAQPGRVFTRLVTGKEPPNEEARRFLEQTRPLRERLLAITHTRNLARADKVLSESLARLWNGPTSAAQRARTFALWDECSDDEAGERARAQIEAFVRDREHARSACPYTTDELARLNGKRLSKRPFAPCEGGPPAQAP